MEWGDALKGNIASYSVELNAAKLNEEEATQRASLPPQDVLEERARRAKVVYEELLEEDGENAEMTIMAKARLTTATARAGIRGLPSADAIARDVDAAIAGTDADPAVIRACFGTSTDDAPTSADAEATPPASPPFIADPPRFVEHEYTAEEAAGVLPLVKLVMRDQQMDMLTGDEHPPPEEPMGDDTLLSPPRTWLRRRHGCLSAGSVRA